MRYTFGNNGFLDSPRDRQEDVDPMGSLANLSDCMLVLACGLMMALVAYWQLDLPSLQEMDSTDMQQVEDVETITGEITSTTNPYMELGTVYQDPATGKLYMLAEVQDEAEDEAASDTEAAADSAADAEAAGELATGEVATGTEAGAAQGAQESQE